MQIVSHKLKVTELAQKHYRIMLKQEVPFIKMNFYKSDFFALINIFLGKYHKKGQKRQQTSLTSLEIAQSLQLISEFVRDQQLISESIQILSKDPFPNNEFYLSKNRKFFEENLLINYTNYSFELGLQVWALNNSENNPHRVIKQRQLKSLLIASLILQGAQFQSKLTFSPDFNTLLRTLIQKNRFVNKKLLSYLIKHWDLIISTTLKIFYREQLKLLKQINQRETEISQNHHHQNTNYRTSQSESEIRSSLSFISIDSYMTLSDDRDHQFYQQEDEVFKGSPKESIFVEEQNVNSISQQSNQNLSSKVILGEKQENESHIFEEKTKKILKTKIYRRPKKEQQRKNRQCKRYRFNHKFSQVKLFEERIKNQQEIAISLAFYIHYAMKCTNLNLSLDRNDYEL